METRSLARNALLSALLTGNVALSGCASMPVSSDARGLPPDPFGIPASDGLSLAEAGVTAVDADMRAFLAEEVTGSSDSAQLRQLIRAVIHNPRFRLEYDDDTRTAAETFRALRGNCLSFTNLFIALARELGLEASYQEVDVPPTWTLRDDSFVVSRHVNSRLTLQRSAEHVVDFNMAEFRSIYPRRAISDERAAAHYYSNLGVERMEAGDADAAYAHFRRALAMDRTLAQAWVNLGAWYRRQGSPALAEASYLEALRVNPHEYVAMGNLAGLHASQNRPELALWFRKRVSQYRLRNPYYSYERGKTAYLAGDFSAATKHLREAIRLEANDATFYSLLGLTYRQLGRAESARKAFSRAVELADDEDLRSAVRRKLDLLGAPSAGL